jgi:hypothetical protein
MFSLTRDEFDALAPLLWSPRPARRPAERRKRDRAHGTTPSAPQRFDHRRQIHHPDIRVFLAMPVGRSRRVGAVRPFN